MQPGDNVVIRVGPKELLWVRVREISLVAGKKEYLVVDNRGFGRYIDKSQMKGKCHVSWQPSDLSTLEKQNRKDDCASSGIVA